MPVCTHLKAIDTTQVASLWGRQKKNSIVKAASYIRPAGTRVYLRALVCHLRLRAPRSPTSDTNCTYVTTDTLCFLTGPQAREYVRNNVYIPCCTPDICLILDTFDATCSTAAASADISAMPRTMPLLMVLPCVYALRLHALCSTDPCVQSLAVRCDRDRWLCARIARTRCALSLRSPPQTSVLIRSALRLLRLHVCPQPL